MNFIHFSHIFFSKYHFLNLKKYRELVSDTALTEYRDHEQLGKPRVCEFQLL